MSIPLNKVQTKIVEPQGQQLALQDLDADTLLQIKRQLDEEIDHLTNSFGALKLAENKFKAGKESAEALLTYDEDKEILVPLTSSLYVPGRLKKKESLIVDVGTGYFVEKSPQDAKTYFNTKLLSLRKSLDDLQPLIEQKQDNRRALIEILQVKLSEREREREKVAKSKP